MLSLNALKCYGVQNKALKLYSSILNVNKSRNFCIYKFHLKNNLDGMFLKFASAFGYGIAVFFGISSFRVRQRDKTNVGPETINYNRSFCESADVIKNPQSPRNSFNFLADVVERTQNSVVYIEINARHPYTGQHIPISNGSGFIVKEDGLILTAAHVVNHFGQVTVKLYDETTFSGVIEDIDTESDLATVRIKAENLPALPLGCSSDTRPGEFVIAMGNPLSLSHTITSGVVSSTNRKGKELGLHKMSDYIQTDASIHVGNSGGPLVNLDGEVIGINTMKVTEGISFAIPSDRAIEFLKKSEKEKGQLSFFKKNNGCMRNKFLGITMLTLSPSVIHKLKEYQTNFPQVEHGVLVWRVMIGSPSYEAGIRPGDVITEANKCEVKSSKTIMSLLEKDDVLHLTIKRGKESFNITVQLVEPVMP